MVKEFIAWIKQGNLVAIAVGLVVALAVAALVQSLVEDIITPLIGAIGGTADFGALNFKVNGSRVDYGQFINAAISFLVIGFVCFMIVKAALKFFKEDVAISDPVVDTLGEIRGLLAEQNTTLSKIASK